MKFYKMFLLAAIVVCIPFFTAGCIEFKNSQDTSGVDGGVFKSVNKGQLWQQKVLIPTNSGRPRSFAGLNISTMTIDPSDHKAIYYGSIGNGLFYTYDGGENWQHAEKLGRATINDVAIDPSAKCIIFATIGNKLFRSTDCSRTWKQVYYDNDPAASVDAVAVDHFDGKIIYIGINRGDIVKSFDRGESWQTVKRFKDKFRKLIIDPNDSRVIYALTGNKGIFRSNNGGNNWQDMNDVLKNKEKGFNIGTNLKDLILLKDEPDVIILAAQNGIIRSNDQGKNWDKVRLIPPDNKALINSVAVNPKNSQEVYYVTNTTFNTSIDGGVNWTPKKLPTTRAGWELLIDPEEPNVMYMGVRSLQR